MSKDPNGNITISPKALAALVLALLVGAGGAGTAISSGKTEPKQEQFKTELERMDKQLTAIQAKVNDQNERMGRMEAQLEFLIDRERAQDAAPLGRRR